MSTLSPRQVELLAALLSAGAGDAEVAHAAIPLWCRTGYTHAACGLLTRKLISLRRDEETGLHLRLTPAGERAARPSQAEKGIGNPS